MIHLHARFRDAFAQAFSPGAIIPATTAQVKAGIVGLHFSFASEALAAAYLEAFAVGSPEAISLSIQVLTPSEIDLSGLIPEPASQGRNFVDRDYVAVWYPDDCPVLYLFDRGARRGIVWLPQRQAPKWELSRPACPLIQASLFDGPWTAAHGGAVGRNGRVLLLAGKGKAGKTTAALACAEAGWDYAGDDYILVNSRTGGIEPLYISARLRMDMASAFAHLLPTVSRGVSHDDGDCAMNSRSVAFWAGTEHRWSARGDPLAAKAGLGAARICSSSARRCVPCFVHVYKPRSAGLAQNAQ